MGWVSNRSSHCGFFFLLRLCEAGLKSYQAQANTTYIQEEWDSSQKKHHTRDTRWLQQSFQNVPQTEVYWPNLNSSFSFVFFFFYKEWKFPCLSGKKCKVLCGLSLWFELLTRVTVKLQSSLLESAIMQIQMKQCCCCCCFSNTQTNLKVRKKKCTL